MILKIPLKIMDFRIIPRQFKLLSRLNIFLKTLFNFRAVMFLCFIKGSPKVIEEKNAKFLGIKYTV